MKKGFFYLIVALLLLCVGQFAFANFAQNQIESNIKNLQNYENTELLSYSADEGIFSTHSEAVFSLYGAQLKLSSDAKHILGFISGRGELRADNELGKVFATLFARGQEKLDFYFDGSGASTKISSFELKDGAGSYYIEDLELKLDSFGNLSADARTAGYSEPTQNVSLSEAKARFEQKSEDEIKGFFSSKKLEMSAFVGTLSAKGIELSMEGKNSLADTIDAKIKGKIATFDLFDAKLKNIDLDADLIGANLSTLGDESVLNLSLSSLNDEKITLSARISLAQLGSAFDGEFSGELNATARPSQILGSLGELIAPYEDKILRQNEGGFSLSFKSQNNDIIFNESISLSTLIANEFLNLLSN